MDPFSSPKTPASDSSPPAASAGGTGEQARTRARRRLIGVAMLMVVGVLLFPPLFESSPRPVQGEQEVAILDPQNAPPLALPAAERGDIASGIRPLGAMAPVAGLGASVPAPPQAASAPMAAASRDVPSALASPAPLPAPSAPAAASAVAKPPSPPARPASAAAPRPKPAPVDAALADERFIVQVGTFSDPAGVREVRSRLDGLGIKSYVQVLEAGGTRRIRVRIGPFNSRAEAERAIGRLKSSGLSGSVLSM